MYEESDRNKRGCKRQRSNAKKREESESLPITMCVLAIRALLVGGYALSIITKPVRATFLSAP